MILKEIFVTCQKTFIVLHDVQFNKLRCIGAPPQGFAWSPSLAVFAWQLCLLEVVCLSSPACPLASTFPLLLPVCSFPCFVGLPFDSDRLPIMSRNSRKLSLSLPVWSNFLKVASICPLFRFLHTSLNSWERNKNCNGTAVYCWFFMYSDTICSMWTVEGKPNKYLV